MSFVLRSASLPALAVAMLSMSFQVSAQGHGSALPPTPPTAIATGSASSGNIAPIAGVASAADRAGARRHRAQVNCAGGQLEVHADNSSLNSILRSVAQCTGMKISGGVVDQRVFGNYGPAMPATVLATLLDGTGTNVVLRETAADQPAELILTPRITGPTPPSPTTVADEDVDDVPPNSTQPGRAGASGNGTSGTPVNANTAPVAAQPNNAPNAPGPGVVSGPVSIPQPINNVNGSPNNTSPNAANYPTTDSVPLDSLPTPSTTPATTGIVDAPNPPPAGSDTAALLNGRTTNMPGNTTIIAQPTNPTATPAAASTAPANPDAANGVNTPAGALTPQQVYEQLQKLRQQIQQQGQPSTSGTPPQ